MDALDEHSYSTSEQVAEILGISCDSLRSHIYNIGKKLKIRGRVAILAAWKQRNKLLTILGTTPVILPKNIHFTERELLVIEACVQLKSNHTKLIAQMLSYMY